MIKMKPKYPVCNDYMRAYTTDELIDLLFEQFMKGKIRKRC